MEGVPAKDDKPAKPPVDTVTLTALGNAISVACFIGGTLEKESLATIASAVASVVMTCAVTGEIPSHHPNPIFLRFLSETAFEYLHPQFFPVWLLLERKTSAQRCK